MTKRSLFLGPPPSRRITPAPEESNWRSRGYLPHFERAGVVQALTFRLHDSVPSSVIDAWKSELTRAGTPPDLEAILRKRLVRYEDAGHGACWLREERIAALVEGALLDVDGERYRLIAWCLMPNHVHGLIETTGEWSLDRVVHGWKSYTAHEANRLLGRTGRFWAREYHDRFIRDDDHLATAIRYIENNPVAAGLALRAESWRWSSARRRA
ncbi:MAG TPA: transposase [Thermoanaerobaculia bacterium]|nr:transposase [Thermoanaerobaculia bacterium]